MSFKENKEIANRLAEFISSGNKAIAEEIIASDFINHNPGPNGKRDRESFIQLAHDFLTGFSNMQWLIDDIIGENDRVAIRGTFKGDHTGDFNGISATNNKITSSFIGFLRIKDGKIVERWFEWDMVGFLKQLGVFPAQ